MFFGEKCAAAIVGVAALTSILRYIFMVIFDDIEHSKIKNMAFMELQMYGLILLGVALTFGFSLLLYCFG